MYDQQEENIWTKICRWILIWQISKFVLKCVVLVYKLVFMLVAKIAKFIWAGINKLIPIIKIKIEKFKKIYNCKKKSRLDNKTYKKNIKVTKKLETNGKNEEHQKTETLLKIKKIKYWWVDFFYKNEILILCIILLCILTILAIIILEAKGKWL